MALPEFQRGYVWNRDQVRGLFVSLYRRHPVGGLLVWATESKTASSRGDGQLAAGVVKLLLDGQQRMTTIYGVVRGHPPKFFDGDKRALTGLMFHLENQIFEFYQPIKMKDDPLWIDVTELMSRGQEGLERLIESLAADPRVGTKAIKYSGRISRILGILEIDLHTEEVTGSDKSLDVVVDIFNRVNSGGTKLSKGDLALAKICADWPEARDEMRTKLKEWERAGYKFNLDWLLRSVNTVLTGEAKFQYLHDRDAAEIRAALGHTIRHIDNILNIIGGRLGLGHNRVFFSRYAVPVMVRYLDLRRKQKLGPMNEKDRDKLLFWFVESGMWGRFSGSTETYIDKDLESFVGDDGGLDKLLDHLRIWHGSMRVEANHFSGWSRGARFYPVLYMMTRMGQAMDWGTGIALKANLLGNMSKLEVHHIFPRAQLKKNGYNKTMINALGNFCFLTKDTNLIIRDALPEVYFEGIEKDHPGALASQWVPMDRALWKMDRYPDFLEARRELLALEVNKQLEDLLHGDSRWLDVAPSEQPVIGEAIPILGAIESDEEEADLNEINDWVVEHGMHAGEMSYDYSDPDTGQQIAILDLVWPNGVQEELSEPVAVLLNEGTETIRLANRAGFRCFTSKADFMDYVSTEVLALESTEGTMP